MVVRFFRYERGILKWQLYISVYGQKSGYISYVAWKRLINCKKICVVCFLLGYSPASEVYMSTFRNNLSHLHRQVPTYLPMKMEQSVPKRRHIKFRLRGIIQKKAYVIQNTAEV